MPKKSKEWKKGKYGLYRKIKAKGREKEKTGHTITGAGARRDKKLGDAERTALGLNSRRN